MSRSMILFAMAALLLLALLSSVFVVKETEKALVLQFGEIRAVKNDAGIGFKIPLIQQVVKYDDRIQSLQTEEIEITPSDQRRLVVDAFARYRISDLRQFRQATGNGGIETANNLLQGILKAQVRAVLGADQVTSDTILSEGRAELMQRIRDQARTAANAMGVEIVDVRLKQTILPQQNTQATFERMKADRVMEAADERARGGEAAQRVRAQADREAVEFTSKAQKDAEIIRGLADAKRAAILAEAYNQDPEFFDFYRSLAAYESALKGGNTSLVLSPDSEFFEYLNSAVPELPAVAPAAPATAAVTPQP